MWIRYWTQVYEQLTGNRLEHSVPDYVWSVCSQLSGWLEVWKDNGVQDSLHQLKICESPKQRYMVWESEGVLSEALDLFQLRNSYITNRLEEATEALGLLFCGLLLLLWLWMRVRDYRMQAAEQEEAVDGWYWIRIGKEGDQSMFVCRRRNVALL
jgi:hypothetical protein